MTQDSAVSFPSPMRVHLALAVRDVAASTAFYRLLFGVEPTKVKPDYVKFEVASPAVNLTLNQHSDPVALPPPMHLGIQVKSRSAVHQMMVRFQEQGQAVRVEQNTTCCYAVQDKIWLADPDHIPWEIFVVTEANSQVHSLAPSASSADVPGPASACCR
jgi:catechol 2,3-dioxygenase-like lactoylglutathione lyase family enzyme